MTPRSVHLPSLIFDLQEIGAALWCVATITEPDRAAFTGALRSLDAETSTALQGARRTLLFAIGETDAASSNPTRVTLRPATVTSLAEALGRGEEELRVEGALAIEVLSTDYVLGSRSGSSALDPT